MQCCKVNVARIWALFKMLQSECCKDFENSCNINFSNVAKKKKPMPLGRAIYRNCKVIRCLPQLFLRGHIPKITYTASAKSSKLSQLHGHRKPATIISLVFRGLFQPALGFTNRTSVGILYCYDNVVMSRLNSIRNCIGSETLSERGIWISEGEGQKL